MAPDAERRALARRLFARALETPGGLKVQTIHAFCTQLLHQFPFEANVAARFAVLDETEQTQLLEQLTLARAARRRARSRQPARPRARHRHDGGRRPDVSRRGARRDRPARRDQPLGHERGRRRQPRSPRCRARSASIRPRTATASKKNFLPAPRSRREEWAALAAALAQGGKTDAEQARRFSLLASLPRSDRVETYLDIFCTASERSPRKSIVTKAIKDAGLVERLAAEQGRVCALLERRRAVICRDRSAALLTVAYAVLTRYHDEKARRGLLDYDDLIDKTLALLTNVDAAWVHYKLDLGIDHLLIDEAQDTSSKQWQIVRQLVAEFTAGAGARSVTRTIFAVGDEKQSIYSFQNAAPKEFAEMRRPFRARA